MTQYPEITVDSRGCGSGKTFKYIYPLLAQRALRFERTLVVVAGIELQKEYYTQMNDLYGIQVRVINSEDRWQDDASTVARIASAMRNLDNTIVCITHQAFQRYQVELESKLSWHLIIDEAFDPIRAHRYRRKLSNFDWGLVFTSWDDPIRLNGEYFRARVREDYLDSFSENSETMRMLVDPMWQTHMSLDTYAALSNPESRDEVEVFQLLDPEIFTGWQSIHLAAGAFHHTFMSDWCHHFEIPYKVIEEFVPQELPFVLHTINKLNWSKSKENDQRYQTVRQEYTDYVKNFCAHNNLRPLVLRNKSSKQYLPNQYALKHNPHGLNGLSDYRVISLESALNPTKNYTGFLKDFLGLEKNQITIRFSAYLFYQCAMRMALRKEGNTQLCHVFCLDNKSAIQLTQFMIPDSQGGIADIPTSWIAPEDALSESERNKRAYLKRKQNSHVLSKSLLETACENTSDISPNSPNQAIWGAVNKSLTRSRNAKGDQQREKLARLLDHLTKTA